MTSTWPRMLAVCLCAIAGCALAQSKPGESLTYPTKPIRMVVPSAPGGGTDIVARLIAQGLQDAWGQTVVVDNRGGAGGIPAVTMVAKNSLPDGYTMCLGSNGHLSFAPAIYRRLQFDPQKDLVPVSLFAEAPFLLVVHPSVPAKSVKDLIALAKAQPGTLTYGSGGNSSSGHLAGALFEMGSRAKLTHVPYKGA